MELDQPVEALKGQILRLNQRREVAIYLRGGKLWVADFLDGCGELFEPETWFRFHCGTLDARDAHLRMLRESGVPLSVDIVAKIENLHRSVAESRPSDSDQSSGTA